MQADLTCVSTNDITTTDISSDILSANPMGKKKLLNLLLHASFREVLDFMTA